MRRLLQYMKPYRKIVAASLVLLLVDSLLQIIGPLLTKLAVDRYLVPVKHVETFPMLDRWLAHDPWTGLSQIALIYLAVVVLGFFFDFGQTYLMQWTGQKAMF
ncbi:MAG: ABC transporter ATP-binding protein, partial [Acidobacteriota bacterium]|nr:ABC transporter ATP-binding protein [Acidobacteriota bacterium]